MQRQIGKRLQWICLMSISLLLSACTPPLSSQTATALNQQTAECLNMTQQYVLAKALEQQNLQIIQVGDEIQMRLATDQFFYPQSNHLRQTQLPVLQKIVQFINVNHPMAIEVTGFTDTQGDYQRNLGLSRAQAQAIAQYLWDNHLNTRLIAAQGEACHGAIAFNNTAKGRKENRRIEIDFRRLADSNYGL